MSYYSYERLPKGPLPAGYLDVVPDAAFEVRSPRDRWPKTRYAKVAELLNAGVSVFACSIRGPNRSPCSPLMGRREVLYKGDMLTLPNVFPGFELPIARLFE